MKNPGTYDILVERLGYPGSARLRRVLEKLMTPEEAEIARALPAPPADISAKLGISEAAVRENVAALHRKGAVVSTGKGSFFARDVHQIRNASASIPSLDNVLMPELADLWEEFSQAEWYPVLAEKTRRRAAEGLPPASRVVPARQALEGFAGLLPGEDIRAMIDKAEVMAVAPCPCRRQSRKCDKMVMACFQFNKGAEYTIARGTGQELSKVEAIQVFNDIENDGLVHTLGYDPNFTTVCNCCKDCCQLLYPLFKYNLLSQGLSKSRFEAAVDQESCDGCQDCVERCQFDAIEMRKAPGSKRLKAHVDPEKCWGCGLCVIACPSKSLKLNLARPNEFVPALFTRLEKGGELKPEDIHRH